MKKTVIAGMVVCCVIFAAVTFAGCVLPGIGSQPEKEYADQLVATRYLGEKIETIQLSYMDAAQPYLKLIAADPDNTSAITETLSHFYTISRSMNAGLFINASGCITAFIPKAIAPEYLGICASNTTQNAIGTSALYTTFPYGDTPSPGLLIPVYADDGTYVGSVIVAVDMAYYLALPASEFNDTIGWRYWVLTDDGLILQSPVQSMIGKNLRGMTTPDIAGLSRAFETMSGDKSGGAVTYTAYSYSKLKPREYVATWDTIPVTRNGDSSLIVMITSQLDDRQSSSSTIRSTDRTLEEFVSGAYLYAIGVGKESAIAEFNNLSGKFTTREYNIFAFDQDGIILADAFNQGNVGYKFSYVDKNGVNGGDLVYKRALQGGGYAAYFYPDPYDNQTEHLMVCYVMQAGEDWYVAASGRQNTTIEQVDTGKKDAMILYLRSVLAYAQSVDKGEAVAVLNDPTSPYYSEEIRFFAMDYNGTTIIDPQHPEYVGKNYMGMTGIYGNSVTRDAIVLAKEGGGKQYEFVPLEGSRNAAFELRLEYILPVGDDWLILASIPIR